MSSKYVDSTAIIQVIGCVFKDPSLLDLTDKYVVTEDDFPNPFHKIIYGSIYKIYELGAEAVTLENISDFLSSRPKSEAIYKQEKGEEWLLKAAESCTPSAFDYYYKRLKKFTLLRAYDNCGINVTDIFDPDNILDTKKKQLQEENLDNSSLEQLADIIDKKIDSIRIQYVNDDYEQASQAGEGVFELINSLKERPEAGVPLYGKLMNTITRGARLRKFYLRSGATGTGKSRSLAAEACYIGCNKIYDINFGWISTGPSFPTLFIATEQDLSEVQTMMLAFLSAVNEEHILNGMYVDDEEERVQEAARILASSNLYVEELPDFSLQDVENKIFKNMREHDVRYVFFDYVHTSMKILEEITRRSGGVKLREDNVLFMLSTKLKDICNKHDVFIRSATQLNGNYVESDTPDQNLLRGAKSIADKIDYGEIMLNVRDEDLVSLEPVLANGLFKTPNIKISVYKNRRGRYKGIYLWCDADLGCCRINPMFATTYNYELVPMEDVKIEIDGTEPGAF